MADPEFETKKSRVGNICLKKSSPKYKSCRITSQHVKINYTANFTEVFVLIPV